MVASIGPIFAKMVRSCSAPNCRSGSDGASASLWKGRVTFYAFPRDLETRSRWLEALGRREMSVTPHTAVCSLHFREGDFVESNDSNLWRRRSMERRGMELSKRRWIAKKAVPSVFPSREEWEEKVRALPLRSLAPRKVAVKRENPCCVVDGCQNQDCAAFVS